MGGRVSENSRVIRQLNFLGSYDPIKLYEPRVTWVSKAHPKSPIMESAPPILDAADKSLLEKGFVEFDDPSLGASIVDMERRGFPYFTEYGLEFCAKFALDPVSTMNLRLRRS